MTALAEHAAYRASDVEWVPRVPAHWLTVPFRSVFRQTKIKNSGMVESNLLSLSYGQVVRRSIDATDGLLPESFETYQIVEPGQIVFRFTDLQNDHRSLRSAIVDERGIITSAYLATEVADLDPVFANYLMRSYDTTKVFYGLGGGVRQSLKFADVSRIPVLVPPLDEQRAIADFLDDEVRQIDRLIAEQEGLIGTLRERRAAVIAHVIGEASEADTVRLGYYAKIGNGSTPLRANLAYWADGTIPWLNSSVVNLGTVTESDQFVTETALAECHLPMVTPGSILVGLTGQGKTRGMATLLETNATISQHLAYITPMPERFHSRFLLWSVRADVCLT